MFAVSTRISAHARELGPNLIDQELLLFSFSDGESSLQNIICKDNHQKPGQVTAPTGSNSLAN